MAKKADILKLLTLVKQVRPECAANLTYESWIADRVMQDFPNIDITYLRSFFETKLAYFTDDIKVPTIMMWCRTASTQWTQEKTKQRDEYFDTPKN